MVKFLSTLDRKTLLNLSNVLSIKMTDSWNRLHGYCHIELHGFEQGIYAELSMNCYIQILNVSCIKSALTRIEDVDKQKIIERSLANEVDLTLLLFVIMGAIKDQLLNETSLIDLDEIIPETLLRFCAINDMMEMASKDHGVQDDV
ncbi:hypothetical protein GSUET_04820 [Geobacter sulfurreducens subsp. ethanolicus]|uniref:hypothetical protein n=1 Tax=Geobacter sulfurreducens TaxID=35554 RepID=UPI002572E289|nr:hypothetical protein [Geobacter sulfurreducens]BEH08870.1 hypothetical protein GSUET_04820 [Geobacter sulfurreducens subsp. ethanolicus]